MAEVQAGGADSAGDEESELGGRSPRWLRLLVSILPVVLAFLLWLLNHLSLGCELSSVTDWTSCSPWPFVVGAVWLALAVLLSYALFRVITFDDGVRLQTRSALAAERQRAKDLQAETQTRLDEQTRALTEQALRLRDGFRSVTMIPNLAQVVDGYPEQFSAVAGALSGYQIKLQVYQEASRQRGDRPPGFNRETEIAQVAEHIRKALQAIVRMTATFGPEEGDRAGASTPASAPDATGRIKRLNASVMLPFEERDLDILPAKFKTQPPLPPAPSDAGAQAEHDFEQRGNADHRSEDGRLRFAQDAVDPRKLDGLLVLVPDLSVGGVGRDSKDVAAAPGPYDGFAMPIRTAPRSEILPGAPTAILQDSVSVCNNARALPEKYRAQLSSGVYQELATYFGPDGEGKDIRSFCSIRLGDGKRPVGVLAIDSDHDCIIGSETDSYRAFSALLLPMTRALRPAVDYYAALWREGLREGPTGSKGGTEDAGGERGLSVLR